MCLEEGSSKISSCDKERDCKRSAKDVGKVVTVDVRKRLDKIVVAGNWRFVLRFKFVLEKFAKHGLCFSASRTISRKFAPSTCHKKHALHMNSIAPNRDSECCV